VQQPYNGANFSLERMPDRRVATEGR